MRPLKYSLPTDLSSQPDVRRAVATQLFYIQIGWFIKDQCNARRTAKNKIDLHLGTNLQGMNLSGDDYVITNMSGDEYFSKEYVRGRIFR